MIVENAWHCEDEEEAYGVELLLQRAGIAVRVRDDGNEVWFDIEPRDAERAAALHSRLAQHFVRNDERAEHQRLDRRDRWVRRSLYGFAAAITVVMIAF